MFLAAFHNVLNLDRQPRVSTAGTSLANKECWQALLDRPADVLASKKCLQTLSVVTPRSWRGEAWQSLSALRALVRAARAVYLLL
jgi:hypothetical protein